jgi:hypothetical protein
VARGEGSEVRRRKRKLLLAAVLVPLFAPALVCIAALALWPRPDRVTPENYDRIHGGMTRAEVEVILGPPADYRNGPTRYEKYGPPEGRWFFQQEFWWYDDGTFHVSFDETDRVLWSRLHPARRVKEGALGNLRWRLKRQWRRWFQ